MYKAINYFKGLNSLRFFAAYFVVIHHAEQIRWKYGLMNFKADLTIFSNGPMAVTFFFVLSGFLITYLLLKEREIRNTISVKRFYIRRILRIWPLYFLLVFLGTLIIPWFISLIGHNYEMPYTFGQVIGYYVLFMPILVNIIYGHNLLEPLWSVGVEEVFYLIWAPLFKFAKQRILPLLLGLLLIKTGLNLLFFLEIIPNGICSKVINALQFEAMAIGGLGAYWIFNKTEKISESLFFSNTAQIIIYTLIFIRIFAMKTVAVTFLEGIYTTPIISALLFLILYCWLIINVSLNDKNLIRFDGKYLNYLGEISYGIYMYHMVVIFGVYLIMNKILASMNDWIGYGLFYIIVSFITIYISILSKKYFEDKFLSYKKRFINY